MFYAHISGIDNGARVMMAVLVIVAAMPYPLLNAACDTDGVDVATQA